MIKFLCKAKIGAMGSFCAALVLVSFAIFSPGALCQTYPAKPIRIVVVAAPAGGADVIARIVGARLAEALGQQVVIDNRAGASGRIGAEIAAKAAPDGYTLMMLSGTLTIVNAMYKDLKYNLVKDFAPISLLGTTPFILVVNPSVPAASIKELVTLAKSRPGALKYGSGGSGSTQHLSAEIFKFMTGCNMLHVPYKGGTPALTSTLSGEVDMTIQPLTACVPMIKSGRLRALGVTSSKRTAQVPDVPSISESVPGYEFVGFYGLVAPAKTPPAIVSKLNSELVKAIKTKTAREQVAATGAEALGTSQQDFAVFISAQLERMREAVKLAGAVPED